MNEKETIKAYRPSTSLQSVERDPSGAFLQVQKILQLIELKFALCLKKTRIKRITYSDPFRHGNQIRRAGLAGRLLPLNSRQQAHIEAELPS